MGDGRAVVRRGRGDLDQELEAPRTHQRAVEGLQVVGGAHHEDHLVLAEAVHLREELVDHRVLHPRARVRPALVREGVDLVEDHHRRAPLCRAWRNTRRRFSSDSPTHFDFSSGPDTMITWR
jgi:hypothetical protein